MIYSKYTFFYSSRNPFSNWHMVSFKEGSTVYNCSEQYMMAEKAKLFNDEETREKILVASHPRDQKDLGRKVKNFDKVKWEANARKIMYRGCYLKFTQNDKILKTLFETKGTLLVEASKDDIIWGVGLSEDNPLINDPNNWKGTNWLGETLTKLRDDLFKHE